jgi:Rps23 Pro-64 3,4-dihydroxylase Tpa1-like proline 4-hydroxylase
MPMFTNINHQAIVEASKHFKKNKPFSHCAIDNFFTEDFADALAQEMPEYSSDSWHFYNNQIEIKKTCNNWNVFPKKTYLTFKYLNSQKFTDFLENTLDISPLSSDDGLNGGGWHIHKSGGKLNPHLDYSIHPKLGLQRKINIIIYLNKNWKPDWGGHLGLWSHDKNSKSPDKLIKEIAPVFNRAVIFDTTQNSWHGISKEILSPNNECRKSLAVYYLTTPAKEADNRGKALFAPTKEQKNDQEVLDLIKIRSQVSTADKVYRAKDKK